MCERLPSAFRRKKGVHQLREEEPRQALSKFPARFTQEKLAVSALIKRAFATILSRGDHLLCSSGREMVGGLVGQLGDTS